MTLPSSPATAVAITDLADPRVEDYRALKEHRLRSESGKFIAESELVVRKLFASRLRVRSLLVTAPRHRALEDAIPAGVPVYVASQEILDQVAGFHVHRGCLAIGERPASPTLPRGARTVVVLEDLTDVDNLGALVRNSAAFGAEAIVLSPRCADPFYRKAIRTAMGSCFFLPIVRLERWPDDLQTLRQDGLSLVGAVLGGRATPLPDYVPPARVALLLGAEGPGLSAAARLACDALVGIPMAPGADSLNVATAGAVMLYHLTRLPRA